MTDKNQNKNEAEKMAEIVSTAAADINKTLQYVISRDKDIKAEILANPKAVIKLLQDNILQEIRTDLHRRKFLLQYDYEQLKADFLETCKSQNTKEAYNYALTDFEAYCKAAGLNTPLETTPNIIDKYLIELASRRSPATVRRNAGALSGFFSKFERDTQGEFRNPLRGTKQIPRPRPTRQGKFYSLGEVDPLHLKHVSKDIKTIISHAENKELKAILICMAKRGFRAGGFEQMRIHGSNFKTITKGEEQRGEMPQECLKAIEAAGLPKAAPFTEWAANRVKQAVKNLCNKLYKQGLINYKYSAHDFRHFYALTEYGRNKDIYRLCKLLNHAGIAITEKYLQGLNVKL